MKNINSNISNQFPSYMNVKIFAIRIAWFVFVINTLFVYAALSQTLTNDNLPVTIQSGITMTVVGDALTKTGGTFINNGVVEISGNWINNSGSNVFGVSQGTVVLNGANQNIMGSSSTDFNNLMLLGTGTKTLHINTTVGGANASPAGMLDVGNRALDLNGNILSISNSSVNAITGTTGYIISELTNNSSIVEWNIGSQTGAHVIPFGTVSGDQIPFTFNLTSGNAGSVSAATYPTAADNTPYPVSPTSVTHVRNNLGTDNSANVVDRFWNIDKSNAASTASYTFSYAPSEAPQNGNANMIAQHWTPGLLAWDFPLPGQSNPTSTSTTCSGISNSGVWTLSMAASPLPVELLWFNAKPVDNKIVKCDWTVASEMDNDHFEIERSRNGKEFEFVGSTPSLGNTLTLRDYTLTDYKPYKGISYYRMKQVDKNGDIMYSQIRVVSITQAGEFQFACFPNPNNGQFSVLVNTTEQATIKIMNASGQLVMTKSVIENGSTTAIDLSSFAKGIYTVSLQTESEIKTQRVVVQ